MLRMPADGGERVSYSIGALAMAAEMLRRARQSLKKLCRAAVFGTVDVARKAVVMFLLDLGT